MQQRAAYGTWRSPITADLITADIKGIAELASNGQSLFWLEHRPAEGGRNLLVRRDEAGVRDVTPETLNVRSRVHEYGGGAYAVTADAAYCVNFADQNLYRIGLAGGEPQPITHGDTSTRYADLVIDEARGRVICVEETHAHGRVENRIVCLALDNGARQVLHEGHDFYAAPRLSPDGTQLCFLCWDHPNMPWDGTQLRLAAIAPDGTLGSTTMLAGGADESVVQPEWLAPGRLVFASDRNGWWNLYSYDDGGLYCIHEDTAEYARPLWQLGMRAFTVLDARHVIAERMHDGTAELALIDVDTGMRSPLASAWVDFDALTYHRGAVYFIGSRADSPSAVVEYRFDRQTETTVAVAGTLPLGAEWFSKPEHVSFPTHDGRTAHAYFYPPRNPDYDATGDEASERPPLVVMTHGGPTASAKHGLNFRVQYYTSRGWAVADVNYRGSTGYGRAYRDALKGQWGRVDVIDCESVVAYLAESGHIDPARAAIRGGSAGGYTTLAALTFGDTFKAGASHYGVGDLEALARDTHKFESRYLDTLVGPYPEQQAVYRARSPIHHVERLSCPVIFLQGLQDAIVPPNQAQAMVDALRAKQLPVAYIEFPDEQHGFRNAANVKRAIESEHTFFARIFGIDAPDRVSLEVEHL